MRIRNKKGTSLVELLFVGVIFTLVMTVIFSVWIQTHRAWREQTELSDMRMGLLSSLEVMRSDLRVSTSNMKNKMRFYPQGSPPYIAFTMPIAEKDDGLFNLDGDGKIIADKTVVYHLYDDEGEISLRRTVISPRDNTLTESERQDQLDNIVETGQGPEGSITDKRFLENIENFQITSAVSGYDFYADSSIPVREGRVVFGWAVLEPGMHTIRFEITGKNQDSIGYGIGIDDLRIEPAGAPREMEYFASADAPSSALAHFNGSVNIVHGSVWSNDNYLEFMGNDVGAFVEIEDYYDLWRESSFDNSTLDHLTRAGTMNHVEVDLPPFAFSGRDPGDFSAPGVWFASGQTGETMTDPDKHEGAFGQTGLLSDDFPDAPEPSEDELPHFIAYNAGNSTYNGGYVLAGWFNGNPYYVNEDGRFLYWAYSGDSGFDSWVMDHSKMLNIGDAVGAVYYCNLTSECPTASWNIGNYTLGMGEAPVVEFGPGYSSAETAKPAYLVSEAGDNTYNGIYYYEGEQWGYPYYKNEYDRKLWFQWEEDPSDGWWSLSPYLQGPEYYVSWDTDLPGEDWWTIMGSGDPPIVTSFSPPEALCIRTVIDGDFVNKDADLIRVSFFAAHDNPLEIRAAYITKRDDEAAPGSEGLDNENPSGNSPDEYHNHQQLFFKDDDGNIQSGITIEENESKWSEWTAFPLEEGASYFVTVALARTQPETAWMYENTLSETVMYSYFQVGGENEMMVQAGTPSSTQWQYAELNGHHSPKIWIVGAIEHAKSSGEVTSQVFDTSLNSPQYGQISWDQTTPSGTKVEAKARTDTDSQMDSALPWDVVSYINSTPSSFPAGNNRYVQFRSRLTSHVFWELEGGDTLSYEDYISAQDGHVFPSSASGEYYVTNAITPRMDNMTIDWSPGTQLCRITANVAKRNDYGQARLTINGNDLTGALSVKVRVSKDIAGRTVHEEGKITIEPRNIGKFGQ